MPAPVTFAQTEIEGVLEIRAAVFRDERGFFTETYSRAVWGQNGFTHQFWQDSMSLSAKGTLRGMHYQLEPHSMGKFVRVISGAIFDVGVDLRTGSPTFGKWIGRRLTADNALALYLPAGLAHGFIALEEDTIVYYKSTHGHVPEAERSLAYNDPAVGIQWPMEPTLVSPKDLAAPALADAEYNFVYKS